MRIGLRPRAIRIETPRFRLRSMSRREVARASFPWTTDEAVMHAIQTRAGGWLLRRWQRRFPRCDNRASFCFGIWTRSDGQFIGYHIVQLQRGKVAFIGIVIGDTSWWGKGAAAETRGALVDYLFEVKGVDRVWGTPFARNFPSVYNYQRLNFTYEGTLRRHARSDFTAGADVLVFALLREEWLASRTKSGPPDAAQ